MKKSATTNQKATAQEVKNNAKKGTHAMVLALLFANRINNPRALNKTHFEMLDLDDTYLDDWKSAVKKFYQATANYFNACYVLRSDRDTRKKMRKAVEVTFNDLLTEEIFYGTEDEIKAQALKITVEEVDFLIAKIVGFAKTEIGSFAVLNGEETFRKEVESYLGCKVAGSTCLSEEEFATINAYKSAERNIDSGKKRILDATDNLHAFIKMVNGLKKKSELSEEVENYFEAQIKEQKKAIADMKKRVSDNETYIAEHKKAYNDLLDKLENGRIDEFTGDVTIKRGEKEMTMTYRERVKVAQADLDEFEKKEKEEKEEKKAKEEEAKAKAEAEVEAEVEAKVVAEQ